MRCPRDKKPLEREVFCGVEIDTCPECDGTWLDKGEMAKVVGMVNDLMDGDPVMMDKLPDREPGEGCCVPGVRGRAWSLIIFLIWKR